DQDKTIRLRTHYGVGAHWFSDTSDFVGARLAGDDPADAEVVFGDLRFVDPQTHEPAEPKRAEDSLLIGAAIKVDRELLATGPEYDGEEWDSPHRSFGFVEIALDGDFLDYSCDGLWRENL